MKRILSLALVCCLSVLASAQVQLEGTVNSDGFVVISGTQSLIGIELKSPGGNLIPIADPDADDASAPFDILVANTETEIVFGNLGSGNSYDLDGSLVLSAGYSLSNEFELEGTWGGPLRDEEGPINFTAPVPEPGSIGLVFIALAMVGTAMRRRRG